MSLLTPEFYKHLLLNSTELLSVIDETGVYKFVGDSVEPILGFEVQEMVGKSAFEFIHPDDIANLNLIDLLNRAASEKKIKMPPFRFLSKNKGWRWVECTVTNLLDVAAIKGFMTNSLDITETIEERAKKELHEAYYRSLFEEHPDAVFSLDTRGYFTDINKKTSQILGIPEERILQTHFSEFVQPNDLPDTFLKFNNVLNGLAQNLELSVLSAGGEEIIINLTVFPVYSNGRLIGLQGIGKDITGFVKNQLLVKKHSEQLRKILESITEPFFALDANWSFTFVNNACCDFFEKEKSEFAGRDIWEMMPCLNETAFQIKCEEVARTGKTQYVDETFTYNTSNITLSFSIFSFEGGLAVHFVDTTSQSTVKKELEKLSLVASKTINGVVIMNPQGVTEWVNEGFTRLTGYMREEAIGISPGQLLQGPETDPITAKNLREKYKDEVYFTAEVLNYRKSGEKYWVNIDVTPIKDNQGNLINYIAIQTDITEKKKTEAEQIKLADDLYKQNLNLQQFTYMVSHNLRAPVANAMGLMYLVSKLDKDSDQYKMSLEKLQASIIQLDSVIKDINMILNIRDADRTLPREEVNILNITKEVLSTFQDEFKPGSAVVEIDIDKHYKMRSNKAYLYSIIYNLVSNAVKYKAPERPLKLDISVAKDNRGYVYTVKDNGMGMDMHQVKHQLFKLYKRFHPNTHGKGIGLFLVKTQVETIGGKISVDSEPGIGTTFKLYLGSKHVQ